MMSLAAEAREGIYLIKRAPQKHLLLRRDNEFTYGLLALLVRRVAEGEQAEYEKQN